MSYRLTIRTGLSVAAVALLFAGSSACERRPRQLEPNNQALEAQVSLFNATHDILPLRFQSMRRQFAVDCELVSDDPGRYLRERHLSNRLQHLVLSGEEVSFFETGDQIDGRPPSASECIFSFLTVTDARLPSIAVNWPRSLPRKVFYTDVDAPSDLPPEAPVLIAEADYSGTRSAQIRPWRHRPCDGALTNCSEQEYDEALRIPEGAIYHWSVLGDEVDYSLWVPAELEEMAVSDPENGEVCITGRNREPLSWERTSPGRWRVDMVQERTLEGDWGSGAEGTNCYDIFLEREDGSEPQEWGFCGSERLARRLDPEGLRGRLMVEFFKEDLYGVPPAGYENLTVDIRRETEDGELFETETIELIRGHGVPDHLGLDWQTSLLLSCEPRQEVAACGQVVLPIRLDIETAGGAIEVYPQETVALDINAERRLEFIRGMHRVVADTNCQDDRLGPYQFGQPGAYLELIYYAGVFTFGG